MEIEDGIIWVSASEKKESWRTPAFGIESLIELVEMYKDDPTLLKRYDPQ
jgi:hypothetical protein